MYNDTRADENKYLYDTSDEDLKLTYNRIEYQSIKKTDDNESIIKTCPIFNIPNGMHYNYYLSSDNLGVAAGGKTAVNAAFNYSSETNYEGVNYMKYTRDMAQLLWALDYYYTHKPNTSSREGQTVSTLSNLVGASFSSFYNQKTVGNEPMLKLTPTYITRSHNKTSGEFYKDGILAKDTDALDLYTSILDSDQVANDIGRNVTVPANYTQTDLMHDYSEYFKEDSGVVKYESDDASYSDNTDGAPSVSEKTPYYGETGRSIVDKYVNSNYTGN